MVLASLVILFTFVVLAKFADFSRAFFTFLLYTTELLLNLLFLQILFVTVIFLDDMKLIYMIFTLAIILAKFADFPAGVNISDQKTLPTISQNLLFKCQWTQSVTEGP